MLPTSITLLAGSVARAIQDMQNVGVIFVQATCRAVYVDEDFYASPFLSNTTGQQGNAGSAYSPIDAFGFRSSRVKQSIGRGYKRFVGCDTATVGTGGRVNPTGIGLMNVLKNAMGQSLIFTDEGNNLTFTPAVAQKEKYTTPSGKSAYKYYPTEAAQAPHLGQGILWENYATVRSQTSRQYGRGS
jgi:hypothetical protein